MADIFISYASEDRERVIVLVEALEADGCSVWWDRHIEGGAAFTLEIERALNSAKVVVVVWSVSSVKSDWVLDEANSGKRNGKLIPIQLDATPPPLGFRQYQVVDFSKWTGDLNAEEMLVLAKSIERFTHSGAGAEQRKFLEPPPLTHYSSAVAVLPLENFSGDPDQQFYVGGMHDLRSTFAHGSYLLVRKVSSCAILARVASLFCVALASFGSAPMATWPAMARALRRAFAGLTALASPIRYRRSRRVALYR